MTDSTICKKCQMPLQSGRCPMCDGPSHDGTTSPDQNSAGQMLQPPGMDQTIQPPSSQSSMATLIPAAPQAPDSASIGQPTIVHSPSEQPTLQPSLAAPDSSRASETIAAPAISASAQPAGSAGHDASGGQTIMPPNSITAGTIAAPGIGEQATVSPNAPRDQSGVSTGDASSKSQRTISGDSPPPGRQSQGDRSTDDATHDPAATAAGFADVERTYVPEHQSQQTIAGPSEARTLMPYAGDFSNLGGPTGFDNQKTSVSENLFKGNRDTRATLNTEQLDDWVGDPQATRDTDESDDSAQTQLVDSGLEEWPESAEATIASANAQRPLSKSSTDAGSDSRSGSGGSSQWKSSDARPSQTAASWDLPLRHFTQADVATNVAREAGFVDYALQGELGRGGMGVVYSAIQRSIHRTVALKQVKGSQAKRRKRSQALLSEAIITGELPHPNIVPIHDVGQDSEGNLFYSMKQVEGTPWHKNIRDQSEDENLTVLLDVADAIGFAHSRGVIHRDLKPENVMVGEYGEVLLMDWGLASINDDFAKPETLQKAASPGGSPAYMAPEEAKNFLFHTGWEKGDLHPTTTGTDIYLLGAILFEIVTKHPPHSGIDQPTCIRNAANNVIVPTDSDSELVDVALRAMASDPADRFATALEFQDAVRQYQAHSQSITLGHQAQEQMKTRNYSRAVVDCENALKLWDENPQAMSLIRVAKRKVRQRRVAGYSSFVAFLASIMISFFLVNDERKEARAQEAKAVAAQAEAEKQEKVAVNALVEVQKQKDAADAATVIAKEERGKAEVAKGKAFEAKELAEVAEKKAVVEAVIATQQAASAQIARNTAQAAEEAAVKEVVRANNLRFTQEYESFVANLKLADSRINDNVLGESKRILENIIQQRRNLLLDITEMKSKLAENKAAEQTTLKARRDELAKLIADADGDLKKQLMPLLKVMDDEDFERVNQKYRKLEADHSTYYSKVFNPGFEFSRLWYVCNQGFASYDRQEASGAVGESVAMHPSQPITAIGFEDGTVDVCSYAPGAEKTGPFTIQRLHRLECSAPINDIAFSFDGKVLATADESNTITIWDWASSTPLRKLTGHQDEVLAIAFAKHSYHLVSASRDKTIQLWDANDGTKLGQSIWQTSGGSANSNRTGSGHEYAWDIAIWDDGADKMFIVGTGTDALGRVWDVALDQDGKLTYRGQFDGHVRIKDKDTRIDAYAVAISPDGTQVASAGSDGRVLLWKPDEVIKNNAALAMQRLANSGLDITAPRGKPIKEQQFERLPVNHSREVRSLQYAMIDDVPVLISGGDDTVINLFNLQSQRPFRELRGHEGRVASCQLGPSLNGGSLLVVSASHDGTARLWDIKQYEEFRTIQNEYRDHVDSIHGAAFHPKQHDVIITASSDQTVSIRRLAKDASSPDTDRKVSQSGHDLFLASFADSFVDRANGNRRVLLTASIEDGRLWDLQKATQLAQMTGIGIGKGVPAIAVSDDGEWILTGSGNDQIKLWKVADVLNDKTEPSITIAGVNGSFVTTCDISKDGSVGLVGNSRGGWQLIDLKNGKVTRSKVYRRALIMDVALLKDQQTALTAEGGQVHQWSPDKADADVVVTYSGTVESMQLSPNERFVACVWSTTDGEKARKVTVHDIVETSDKPLFEATVPYASSIRFHPNQPLLLVACHTNDQAATWEPLRLFDYSTAKEVTTPHTRSLVGDTNFACFSEDGSAVFTTSRAVVDMWQANSPTLLRRFSPPQTIKAVGFSADGQFAITGNGDGSVRILDPQSGKELFKHAVQSDGLVRVAQFRPTDESHDFVTICHEKDVEQVKQDVCRVWKWDAQTETVTQVAELSTATSLAAYSSDGKQLLTLERRSADDGQDTVEIVIRDAANPTMIVTRRTLPTGSVVTSAEFYQDEQKTMVAVAYEREQEGKPRVNEVMIWDPKSEDSQNTNPRFLRGHGGLVTSIGFERQGNRIATGSADQTVKLWDPQTSRELLTLKGHQDDVSSVSFSYDGHTLMSTGLDGKVILWFASKEVPESDINLDQPDGAADGVRPVDE